MARVYKYPIAGRVMLPKGAKILTSTWGEDDTRFGRYDRYCYRPNLNMPEGWGLKYCSYEYYECEGFTIIPFADLIVKSDIEESELSIDALFGGVV